MATPSKEGFVTVANAPKQLVYEVAVTVKKTSETMSLMMQVLTVLNGGAALFFNGAL